MARAAKFALSILNILKQGNGSFTPADRTAANHEFQERRARFDCFDGMVISWTIGINPDSELVNTIHDAAPTDPKNLGPA